MNDTTATASGPRRQVAPAGGTESVASEFRRALHELDSRISDIPQALPRILLEASPDDPRDTRWNAALQLRPLRRTADDGGERIGHGFAGESRAPGQHLVEHAPERPDVGALVDRSVPAPAPATCKRRCRESRPACVIAGLVIVGD